MLALTDRDALRRLAADVQRIADTEPRHRVPDSDDPDLSALARAINRLADRADEDRILLAENVASLDATNRELREARDQVVRSARLASVGTLSAGIAHEVGNPLGAILGFVDVARSRAAREGRDTELLDAIRDEAGRIDRIVRGLLDWARAPESSEPRPVAEVVDRVRDLLERQGRLAGVDADWTVDGDVSLVVDQPQRLEQVLMNVLLNALHAVGDVARPVIRLTVREEEGELRRMPARREGDPPELNYLHRRRVAADEEGVASVLSAERVTVIEISDNGPGLPDEAMDRLFDPFFTTKEPGEGTGLGLAICARLLEGMGGSIGAEAAGEGGARFVIRLPMMYDLSGGNASATENQ